MLLKIFKKKNVIIGVLFFMHFLKIQASPYFKMNDNCLKAQTAIYELRISDASKILTAEQIANPENTAVIWLQEYALFITLFISENETDYNNRTKEWESYINQLEKRSFNDPWYRFILSDMYLHRGAVKLKMNALFSAGSDIKTANHLLKENHKLYPAFLPDNKNKGLIQVLSSSIPKSYAWLGSWMGFESNLNEGIQQIELYLKSPLNTGEHKWLKIETGFIYALLQHHYLKKTDAAWKTIEQYTADYNTNVLINYMRATIASYAGKNDLLIDILSQRPHVKESLPFYYMDYMLGVAKLKKQEKDADYYLKIYTVKFKGKNYIKSAYRYLAWYNIINGDINTANTYYSLCTKNGKNFQEEDKQAEKEALDPLRWAAPLLKCRLLFDGHYYKESLELLNTINEEGLGHLKFKLELNYRKARVYQETGNYVMALLQFSKTINLGKSETYYYAAYSSLQTGEIYELLNNKEQAKYYFEKAKNDFPNNQEYRNSIEQKAKSGLHRLGY
ncbi:MAG: hypothetical protein V4613_00170 [Bacteroidota bacterium]